ncbi:hypothetical protein B0T18DRAFT_199232 [Schizothecium vesticola]|uniref:Uncharacterized protein n=1 Tax=Schizothecium vesticola TaxID=314040 RepID=A0AA40K390_9PEZI|nr:hypothetical protein B0T18DRAFT_199232 [Schizothecium vesticola]
MLHLLPCCRPCRRSSSDLNVTCARSCFSPATSNCSPLFLVGFNPAFHGRRVLDRGAGQLRLAAAAAAGFDAVLASVDPYTAPSCRQLHGLPLVLIAGSQPLLLHATRRIRLRFSKMQAAMRSDTCCAGAVAPGFPASSDCSRFRLPQPLGRRSWRDQGPASTVAVCMASGRLVNHGHRGEKACYQTSTVKSPQGYPPVPPSSLRDRPSDRPGRGQKL